MSTTNILPQSTTARTFVRNFNILLKFMRLYGFDHSRTIEQMDKTWEELRAVLTAESDGDILLAASGNQLLLNGAALGTSAADRNFANLLTSIGLSSIHFSSNILREDFDQFVRNFPIGGKAAVALAEKFKRAMDGVPGVRLNEICFVPADASNVSPELAAQITKGILGSGGSESSESWFNDPTRLLQLIAAAEGSRSGGGAGNEGGPIRRPASEGIRPSVPADPGEKRTRGRVSDFWSEVKTAMGGLQAGSGPLMTPEQEDVCKILRLLRQMKSNDDDPEGPLEPEGFQSRLATVSSGARLRFNDALIALASQVSNQPQDQTFLVRLAEHMAIRFAVETYERGDTQVTGVQKLLERMGQEITALRDILGSHETKLKEAGITVDSHADQLERQFWNAVPEATKRTTLLSAEAWCVPPRHVNDYLADLQKVGDRDTCRDIFPAICKVLETKTRKQRKRPSADCAIWPNAMATRKCSSDGPLPASAPVLASFKTAICEAWRAPPLCGSARKEPRGEAIPSCN